MKVLLYCCIIVYVSHTQSYSFSVYEERVPSFQRLSESMGDGREQVHVQAREKQQQQQQQASRDNSTESEEAPSAPPPPPPSEVVGGGGCPQENQHVGKELLNTAVQLPIEMVFNYLFVQEQFMVDVYGMKKTYDVTFTPWEQEDDHQARQATYTMTLPSSNLGPKVSYVTEKQVILPQSKPGEAYMVELEASNTGIPYADAFVVASHYCFTKEKGNMTRIRVWVSIKYKKTLWGLVKTMIEKNTYSGVEGLLAEIATQLGTEADRLAAPRMGNRRRKRMAADKTSGTKTSTSNSRDNAADKGKGGSGLAVVVVMVALGVLATGNVVLYVKLSRLGLVSTPAGTTTTGNRYLSATGSWEAVARLLQRQQEIHKHQVDEWRKQLQQAATLLREVQESLEAIMEGIPEHDENMRRILEEQSVDILTGWLQAEDTLKQFSRIKFAADVDLTNTAHTNIDSSERSNENENDT